MNLKTMQIMAFPGKYIQGNGAINHLPDIMEKYGARSFVVATKSMLATAQGLLADKGKVEQFGGECSEAEIVRIMELVMANDTTALAAIGGGKVIDCCKIVADKLGIPVIVVPTIAATDAPCSGCAVIYTEEGVYDHVYYQKNNPNVVLMDTNIIAKAPMRYLISGMGDGLATFFEANSCRRSGSLNECGGLSTLTAMSIARLCLDTILKYGRQAVKDSQQGIVSEALEAIIEANTLLSGIGFESCGLGAAHSIHNGLTVLAGTHSLYHGEKVAFGVITGLQLIDELNLIDEVYDFFIDLGLPVCFEDLGLGDITEEQIIAVAANCCGEGNFMYHEPFAFDVSTIANAIKEADAIGRKKKLLKAIK
ncbi:MAG: glycerol dehydrogenase [Desulfotomaculaceae bacterium]|nr:glycerol dehydrogenase [Desulfotomaculaceae bacterium]